MSEDLKREFEPQPPSRSGSLTQNENKPPRLKKLPTDRDAGEIQLEDMKERYQGTSAGMYRRQSANDADASDPADAAIQGASRIPRSRERSAEAFAVVPGMGQISPPFPTSQVTALPRSRPASVLPRAYTVLSPPRPSQTQDDLDVMRRRSISQEQELQLHHQIRKLQEQLDQANQQASAAQTALQARLDELDELSKDAEALTETIGELRQENEKLTTERDDARSHIFSLQPYMKDLTPEEVGRVRMPLPSPVGRCSSVCRTLTTSSRASTTGS
jgi:DNA repair exonuclease SbcCD ATPase subunit